MEGWKFSVAIAFLLAACAVDASLPSGVRNCTDIRCPANPKGVKFPNPSDECSYCCCLEGGEQAVFHECPGGGKFNPHDHKCYGEHMCGPCADVDCNVPCYDDMEFPVKNPFDPCGYCMCHPDRPPTPEKCPCGYKYKDSVMDCVPDPEVCHCHCSDLECPPGMDDDDEKRFPNPDDPCGFCCCRGFDRPPKPFPLECPFHERYDPHTEDCVPDPSGDCPHNIYTTPHGPTGGGHVPPGRGCEGTPCPNDPNGVPLYPAGDPQYYCQCDWGGHVHQMPCAGGTIFNFKLQTCI